MRIIDGIKYQLIDNGKIRDYIVDVANKEWEKEDFVKYGTDLETSRWMLKVVDVRKIKVNEDLMRSIEFQKDLKRRIKIIKKILLKDKLIPPLILRGKDLFIFDGYARLRVLESMGVDQCLAYVGYLK